MNEITQLPICSYESNVILKMAKSLPVHMILVLTPLWGYFIHFCTSRYRYLQSGCALRKQYGITTRRHCEGGLESRNRMNVDPDPVGTQIE